MIIISYLIEWNFDDGTSLVLSILFLTMLLLVWCVAGLAAVNPVTGFRHFYRIFQIAWLKYLASLVKICMVGLWIGCNLQSESDKKSAHHFVIYDGVPLYMSFWKLFLLFSLEAVIVYGVLFIKERNCLLLDGFHALCTKSLFVVT